MEGSADQTWVWCCFASCSVHHSPALQHPFSRGRMWLKSATPWESPVIAPNSLSPRADILMLREGVKLARKLGNPPPFSDFMKSEVSPGTNVSTDADWDAWCVG